MRIEETGSTHRFSPLCRRWLPPLRAAALTFLMLGLLISVSAAQGPSTSKPGEHVYLMRGAFNVFSMGLDEIAAKLRRHGIYATVDNYLAWSRIVDEASAEYKSGRVKTIILVGHSSGATAVAAVAGRLGEAGVPVKLAIGLDPTTRVFAAGHVERYINYYAPGGMGTIVDRGREFHGQMQNVSTDGDPAIGHFNIDKNQALQEGVIREIRAAISQSAATAPARAASTPTVPVARAAVAGAPHP